MTDDDESCCLPEIIVRDKLMLSTRDYQSSVLLSVLSSLSTPLPTLTPRVTIHILLTEPATPLCQPRLSIFSHAPYTPQPVRTCLEA